MQLHIAGEFFLPLLFHRVMITQPDSLFQKLGFFYELSFSRPFLAAYNKPPFPTERVWEMKPNT